MFAPNLPVPMRKTPARAGAPARATPTRSCAATCRRCATLLHDEARRLALAPAELDALMDRLQRADPLEAEADYVELFDRGRATSLHLFEHVHGDSRDRGPAMIDLGETYEKAGLVLAPTASCPTTCRWCWSSRRRSRRARRAPSWARSRTS